MSVLQHPSRPTHDLGGTRFTSLATPSRGSSETSMWQVEIDPGTPAVPHSVTREEVFYVLDGVAAVELGGQSSTAGRGDVIVVPTGVRFAVSAADGQRLRMVCCLPVGGQAQTADGAFTPPWAL